MKRKYGLFENRDGKWVRLYPNLEGNINWARRVFQDALLAGAMGLTEHERRLRPVGHYVVNPMDKIMKELG